MKAQLGKFSSYFHYVDKNGRIILIRPYSPRDRERLMEMYMDFDAEDGSLGLPPVKEEPLETWLDYITAEGISIVAEHGRNIVGHLSAVRVGNGIAEVTVFISRRYRDTGLGQQMMSIILYNCREEDFRTLVLTTEKNNLRALHMFRKMGFEVADDRYEYEMVRGV